MLAWRMVGICAKTIHRSHSGMCHRSDRVMTLKLRARAGCGPSSLIFRCLIDAPRTPSRAAIENQRHNLVTSQKLKGPASLQALECSLGCNSTRLVTADLGSSRGEHFLGKLAHPAAFDADSRYPAAISRIRDGWAGLVR